MMIIVILILKHQYQGIIDYFQSIYSDTEMPFLQDIGISG
jgi:hypothetical protein